MEQYPSLQSDFFRKKSGFHHTGAPNNEVAVFAHLVPNDELIVENIHWAFDVLRTKLNSGKILESNESCKEMLQACRIYFSEYQVPASRAPGRDLEIKLDDIGSFLISHMIMTLGMETALQYLKFRVIRFPPNIEVGEVRQIMFDRIDTFIREKIELPSSIIAGIGSEIVKNGDVIMIYDYSSTVLRTLLLAKDRGTNFRVIVVDSRVRLAGKKALKQLVKHEIHCTYILISNVSYHMKEVTRVIMGAEGLTNNCFLLNKVGTALICCIANAYKKPVLVCVETYKLSEKVYIDSICFNVLDPQNELVETHFYEGDTRIAPVLKDFVSAKLLKLNLKYDLTPAKYIDMLITEVGSIPVSSVPVLLREFRSEAETF